MLPRYFPVTAHTDYVGPGSTFVAIKGFTIDGTLYIQEALRRGARTIVVEQGVFLSPEIICEIKRYDAGLFFVPNARLALAEYSAQAAGFPTDKLIIIGITGTKGKTTSTFLLEHILQSVGIKSARITGVSNRINGCELPANLTTPQPDYLHQFFKICVEKGITHVVMEVAAQGLSLHRLATIYFDGIIFTNIAREHFEFYSDIDDYCAAKAAIFKHAKVGALCLANGDNERCFELKKQFPIINFCGFSLRNDIRGVIIETHPSVTIRLNTDDFYCPALMGTYNAENLLAVCKMAIHLGILPDAINAALKTFVPISGRMERYFLQNGAQCIIDYAHNPSSYQALLATLRQLTKHLIVLFGASGTRDKGKRPLMGAIAAEIADIVILTADNPGPEDPLDIIEAIAAGISVHLKHKVVKNPDRACAIEQGCALLQPGSILALLGKGPDEYQVIKGIKHRFSEREIIKPYLLAK